MSGQTPRYLTRFPIIEYPRLMHRIKINEPLSYVQVNNAVRTCRNVSFHYHEKILYVIGDPEVVARKLKENGVAFSKEEPTEVDLERDFPVLRIILYKAFRNFLKRKGFVWKPDKKTSAFASHVADEEQNSLSQTYGIRMIRRLTSSVGTELYIHEGFDYTIEKKGQSLFLTLLLKVTPLIKTDLGQVRIRTKIVTACHKECELKGLTCPLPLWKSTILSAEVSGSNPGWCPYAQSWVRLRDIKGKELIVPAHTLNIESNPHQIRRLNLYKEFRRFSLKEDILKTKTLKALLSYLTSGRDQLWVKVGNDVGAMKVDVTLKEVEVEVVPDAWEAYSLA